MGELPCNVLAHLCTATLGLSDSLGACGWRRGSAKVLGCACSASSINEWTGERTLRDEDVPEDVRPASVQPLGNYAVQITWQDGFNQVWAAECGLSSTPTK